MENVFAFGTTRVVELGAGDIDTLQRFFDANPGYFLAVTGEPARTDEAAQEFADMPPAGMSYDRQDSAVAQATSPPRPAS